MADADGKMTGRPGVAFVTRGPGATNASAGVHVAFQDSTPMILFVGDLDRADRDREGFQEIDMAAFFAPIAKWAARIDDARRIPEYVARAYRVATAGRPGPVVLAIPEDMLRDEVEALDRPRVPPVAETPDPGAIGALFELLKDAAAPLAIIGGADWSPCAAHHWANFAFRHGIPTAAAFRRQDAVDNACGVYAGQLGYGPNPKLQQRVRDADLLIVVGARLGESTTDGYKLVTPDHPGQILVHVHPDPNELGRVYHADLPICADMSEFSRDGGRLARPRPGPLLGRRGSPCRMARLVAIPSRATASRSTSARASRRCATRSPPTRSSATARAISRAGGTATGIMAACRPSSPRPAGRWATACPQRSPRRLRFKDRTVVCVAGDGDFLMNGQELATAAQYGADLLVILVDNGAYGTIRMHQERDYPSRDQRDDPRQPRFRQARRSLWRLGRHASRRPSDFAPALARAMERKGIRLIHCITDVEVITNQTTIAKLRTRHAERG